MFVCKMRDDWCGDEGAQAMGGKQDCCYCLGVRWRKSEAGLQHVLQDRDKVAVEEFL